MRLELSRTAFNSRGQQFTIGPSRRIFRMAIEGLLGRWIDHFDRQRRRPRATGNKKDRDARKHGRPVCLAPASCD